MIRSPIVLCFVLSLSSLAFAADDATPAAETAPSVSSQVPQVLPLMTSENPNPEPEPPPPNPRQEFLEGPTPLWIWGANNDVNYNLRKTFTANAKSAKLFISCDNAGTVSINGQQVAADVPWDSPKVVDVTKQLKAGQNEIVAHVVNLDGVAAFLCKLMLTTADGQTEYVVSDDTWTATEDGKENANALAVSVRGRLGDAPWHNVIQGEPSEADPVRGMFHGLPGFQVERLYTVPRDEQGSWVAMTVDDRGRIIVSDQGDKGLYRVTPSPIGSQEPTLVEKIPVDITSAQGLLCAFDSLYVSVNGGPGSGLYRVRDTNSDDQYDEVKKLAELRGGGEHGPHALRLSPDGQSIYIICGNHTLPPEKIDASRLPTNWQEDLLLPRMWDANGHARGILAPGGWVAKTDPEGKTWEIVTSGYRNSYDMDFNADGELFVYDADMEWDVGSPWYRPTRVNHATSGSELGWRSGTGKWPSYYVDSLPPLAEIGPGSPVGASFGYGAKFPAKYQKALFICDWTFGTIYAVHLEPSASTYTASVEEFLSRTPLPLTDCEIGKDGALYFTVGGRGTQSELFRATYIGAESTEPVDLHDAEGQELRELRHTLESHHALSDDPASVIELAWPNLGHEDRFIRYAARLAIEHQPVAQWQERALAETSPDSLIGAMVALARQGDKSLEPRLIEALGRLDLSQLDERRQLNLLRAYQLVFTRMGEPAAEVAAAAIGRLDPHYPASSDSLNRELCDLLVFLKTPSVIAKTIHLIQTEPKTPAKTWLTNLERNAGYGGAVAEMLNNQPDGQKIHYVFALRNLNSGWTMEQRKEFFGFLDRARGWSGGASYRGFLKNIDREAFEALPEKERLAIETAGARKPDLPPQLPAPQGPGHDWTMEEVIALGETSLKGRDFKNGERTFAAAKCILCHRFVGDGGATGPDLTQLAGRFNLKDLTEATMNPSKVISDQYKATTIQTKSGDVVTGRIVSETDNTLTVLTNPEDATKVVEIPKSDIEQMKAASVSLMPEGLLKSLNEDEVLDLLAYLLSRGDQGDRMFQRPRRGRR
jgi:putative heme-binding domain-containing protein